MGRRPGSAWVTGATARTSCGVVFTAVADITRRCTSLLRLVHEEHLRLAVLRGLIVPADVRRATTTDWACCVSSFDVGSARRRVLLHGLGQLRLVLVHDGELLLLHGADLVVRMRREPVPLWRSCGLLVCSDLVLAGTA